MKTLRQILCSKISEDDWQQTIIDCLRQFGWTVAHFRAAKTEKGWRTPVQADGKGFPDIIALKSRFNGHETQQLVVECKSENGKVTKDQQKWLDLFAHVPCAIVKIWRPSDWDEVLATARM